jgi:hypothetical protein
MVIQFVRKFPHLFLELEDSLPYPQKPTTFPYPSKFQPCALVFYDWEILAPYPILKLKDCPLSLANIYVFSIFKATLHAWRPYGFAACGCAIWS